MNARIHILLIGMAMGAGTLLAGCAQPILFQEPTWQHVYEQTSLPAKVETKPEEFLRPIVPFTAPPANVLDPERAPRYLSLDETVALALENGTVGLQSVRVPGVAIEDLGVIPGQGSTSSDSIRVLSYQPARVGAIVEAALSRFDPFFSSGVAWHATDEPTQGLSTLNNGNGATVTSSLVKPLASGGVVGVTFGTDYLQLTNPPVGEFGVLNPSYVPRLTIGFEQPLLRDFGTDINQLRSSFPGSTLFPALNNRLATSEGILITRIRHDQARAELERNVNFLLLNVQAAYWNLYGAYVNLYVNNQGLKQAHMSWSISKELFREGRIDKAQLAQIVSQYEQFRGDRMRALGGVIDAERNLRILCGLPFEDGRRLVPVDTPMTMTMKPDWQTGVEDALTLRPELIVARQDIIAKQMNLTLQKNAMLPDLRFQATHTTIGLGSRLDGNGTFLDANGDAVTSNALRSLTGTHFNSWQVGLNLNVPLGFRFERAQVRDARLALTQSFLALRSEEQKAANLLAKQYSRVIETSEAIEIRRRQRVAQAEQVETRFHRFIEWDIKDRYPHVEFLLDAQRQWATSLNQEYQAIIDYNIALATWEFAKGTIMNSCNVTIAEGPMPSCVTVRAVENERDVTGRKVAAVQARSVLPDVGSSLPLSVVAPDQSAPSLAGLDFAAPMESKRESALGPPLPQAFFGMPISR